MMIRILSAVCALLCLVDAAPSHEWHMSSNNPYSAQQQMEDEAARAAQDTRSKHSQCASAVAGVDTQDFEHYVHVCNDRHGVCYYSIGVPCCSNIGIPMSTEYLDIGGRVMTVKHFLTEDDSLCYTVPDDLGSCIPKRECTPACTPPKTACFENTVTESIDSCDLGSCECKPGWAPPDCCECDAGYFLLNGECLPLCRENCEVPDLRGGQCLQCRVGWAPPDCCQCDSGYYLADDGSCKPICTESALQCSVNGCTRCKPGYTGPDCCKCDSGYYRAPDGTCKAPCDIGVQSCRNGVCVCKPGYVGEDCCECDTNYYRASDGTCKSPCLENIVSCSNEQCTCKDGFLGDNCCQVKPPCSAIQDVYFVVDTTLSNDAIPFCKTLYAVQLITAELNPGIVPVATRIGAYVYPQNMHPQDDDVRLVNVGQFQCPSVTRKFHDLVLQLSYSRDKGLGSKINAVATYPDPVINVLAKDIRREIEQGIVPRDRRRVVVILTDGNSDSPDAAIQAAVRNLLSIAPEHITLIVVGLATSYVIPDLPAFREHLAVIANGSEQNVVAERTAPELVIGLVNKMRENGAICGARAQRVIDALNNNQADAYCSCRSAFLLGGSFTSDCNRYCTPPRTHRDCRFPPHCNDLSGDLQSEIMAAVEEVLLERDEANREQ